MLKKLILSTTILSALMLNGCGGGKKNSNPMNDKNVIVILKNVPSGICETQSYRDILSEDFTGIITEEKSNNINCNDYGKKNDMIECGVENYTGPVTGNVACVVGADGFKHNKQAKIVGKFTFGSIIDTKFIQISE